MDGRRIWLRALVIAGVAAASTVVGSSTALAACHAFSVTASPSTVIEGKTVTVTVSRDGAVAPSSIHLKTVDGTATAGSDYRPIDVTVSFTNDTTRRFSVATIDDHVHESSETFSLHLSDPAGCFGSGYVVGLDARVTIADNDPTPSTTPRSTPTAKATAEPTAATPTTIPTLSAKPSPRASSTPRKTTPSPSPSKTAIVAARAASTGSSNGIFFGLAAGLIVAVSGSSYLVRRRRTRS
jgi:LPXTG-motif cell wall-anchored protein